MVQKTSELSLHSSKIWISDNVRGYNPSYLCGLFNWDLVLTTFCTEEVQKRMGFSKPLRSKISKPNFLIYWVTPLCKKLGFSIHLLNESPNWWDVGNHQKRTVYEYDKWLKKLNRNWVRNHNSKFIRKCGEIFTTQLSSLSPLFLPLLLYWINNSN